MANKRKRVGRPRQKPRERSKPTSVSLNEVETDFLYGTAEMCNATCSAVIRRGLRLVTEEVCAEVKLAVKQKREPDFSAIHERMRDDA